MIDSEDDRSAEVGGSRIRGVLAAIGFTVGASLTVAAGALVLFFVTQHGDQLVGSDRLRSLLALVVFVALISIPAYLLAIGGLRRFR